MKIAQSFCFLITLLLFYSVQTHAVILSGSCTDHYDEWGNIYGYTCSSSTRYQLEGTAILQNSYDGSEQGLLQISGILTQDFYSTEDYYGSSASDEIYTDLFLEVGSIGTYSMSLYEYSLDWGPFLSNFSDSLDAGAFTTDGLTEWDIQADGITAFVNTLDGNGDGLEGINLLSSGQLVYVADVELTAVPLPAAVWLFGSGLIALAGVIRRKSR